MRRSGTANTRQFHLNFLEQNWRRACIYLYGAPFVGSEWRSVVGAFGRGAPMVSRGWMEMKSFCVTFLVLLILFFVMMLACGGK
jgi:polyferredoxin